MNATRGSLQRRRLAAGLITASLAVAACGGSDDASDPAEEASTEVVDQGVGEPEPEPAPEADVEPEAEPEPASEPDVETEVDAEPDPEAEEGSDADSASTGGDGDQATVGEFPRDVTDALGVTTIDTAPATVIALDLSMVDAALALGVEVIGYTTFMSPDGPLPEYFGDALVDHAADAEWVGDLLQPNLEAIALADPDLILTSAVRHESIRDELSQIAPTVMSESAGAGWKDSLRLAGAATGREAVAEQLIADYEARAARVGAEINEVAGDPEISVVRFVDVIRLYLPVSFSGTVLEDAGLARPESQRGRDDFIRIISEEEIELADGDVVFYTVFDNEDVIAAVEERIDSPLWQTLDAVSSGQVYPVVDAEWMSSVGIFGAHIILDDLADVFGVDRVDTDLLRP